MLLKTIISPGFSKLTRTAHVPAGVNGDIVSTAEDVDVTWHTCANTEHTDAEQDVLNCRN
jgi:hypothetical protein